MQHRLKHHRSHHPHRPPPPPQQWPELAILQVLKHLPLNTVLCTVSLLNSTWHRLSLEHCAQLRVLRLLIGTDGTQSTTCVYAAERERTLELLSEPPLPLERLVLTSLAEDSVLQALTSLFPRVTHLEVNSRTMDTTSELLTQLVQVLSSQPWHDHLGRVELGLGVPNAIPTPFYIPITVRQFYSALYRLLATLKGLPNLRQLGLRTDFRLLKNYDDQMEPAKLMALIPFKWDWLERCSLDTKDGGNEMMTLIDRLNYSQHPRRHQRQRPPLQLATTATVRVLLPSAVIQFDLELERTYQQMGIVVPSIHQSSISRIVEETRVDMFTDSTDVGRDRPQPLLGQVMGKYLAAGLVRLTLVDLQAHHLPLLGEYLLTGLPELRTLRLLRLRLCSFTSLRRSSSDPQIAEAIRSVLGEEAAALQPPPPTRQPKRSLSSVRELYLQLLCSVDFRASPVDSDAHAQLERDVIERVGRPLGLLFPNLSRTWLEVTACPVCDLNVELLKYTTDRSRFLGTPAGQGENRSALLRELKALPGKQAWCERTLVQALRPLMPSIQMFQYYRFKPIYQLGSCFIAGRKSSEVLPTRSDRRKPCRRWSV